MKSVNPKIIIGLFVVIALAAAVKLMNPNGKYTSGQFWATATVEDVYDVPKESLEKGNTSGPVLMWAAMKANDPRIIKLLVERGADINEADVIFSGTPLSAAAGYSDHPEIIEMLIELGADMTKRVNNQETPLMVAAQYNETPAIFKKLVSLGANLKSVNAYGLTALHLAKKSKNKVAIEVLESLDLESSNKEESL